MNRSIFLVLALALAATGCGPKVQTWLRDDYATVDSKVVKRLTVVVASTPNGDAKQAEMWALLARRYVNQHRNFLVKMQTSAPDWTVESACNPPANGPIEGALLLTPAVQKQEADVQIDLPAKLVRCRDREPVWTGEVHGKWASADETVAALKEHYVKELGAGIEAWVAPAFLALKALVATMPQPTLSDDEQMEKIELGE
jgi:probable lipoprotein (TIGR04455 family)